MSPTGHSQTSHLSVYIRRNPYFNHFLRGISVFGYYPYFSVFCINCRLINRNPQLLGRFLAPTLGPEQLSDPYPGNCDRVVQFTLPLWEALLPIRPPLRRRMGHSGCVSHLRLLMPASERNISESQPWTMCCQSFLSAKPEGRILADIGRWLVPDLRIVLKALEPVPCLFKVIFPEIYVHGGQKTFKTVIFFKIFNITYLKKFIFNSLWILVLTCYSLSNTCKPILSLSM